MEIKTLKDLVKVLTDHAIDGRALIQEIGGLVVEAERQQVEVRKIRHAEITSWLQELRKDGLLESADTVSLVTQSIGLESADSRARAANLSAVLASTGGVLTQNLPALIQVLLPWLLQRYPGLASMVGGNQNKGN
jgi:hypothetical protein